MAEASQIIACRSWINAFSVDMLCVCARVRVNADCTRFCTSFGFFMIYGLIRRFISCFRFGNALIGPLRSARSNERRAHGSAARACGWLNVVWVSGMRCLVLCTHARTHNTLELHVSRGAPRRFVSVTCYLGETLLMMSHGQKILHVTLAEPHMHRGPDTDYTPEQRRTQATGKSKGRFMRDMCWPSPCDRCCWCFGLPSCIRFRSLLRKYPRVCVCVCVIPMTFLSLLSSVRTPPAPGRTRAHTPPNHDRDATFG